MKRPVVIPNPDAKLLFTEAEAWVAHEKHAVEYAVNDKAELRERPTKDGMVYDCWSGPAFIPTPDGWEPPDAG